MRVLCTGPESSGTRLLTKMVDLLDVEAVHMSIPHGDEWWWSELGDFDAAIFITRDPFITEISARQAKHLDKWDGIEASYPERLVIAHEVFISFIFDTPWIPLTYEGLLMRPQWTLDNLAKWLQVEPVECTIEIKDPREEIK